MTSTASGRDRPAMSVSQMSASMPAAAAIASTRRRSCGSDSRSAQPRERFGDPPDPPALAKRRVAAQPGVGLERQAQHAAQRGLVLHALAHYCLDDDPRARGDVVGRRLAEQ